MKKTLFTIIGLTVVIVTIILTGCSNQGAGSVPQELTSSEKLWKDQGLRNYDFTIERQAFAPEDWRGPVNIQVRNGSAVSVTYVSNGTAVTEGKFDNADTIDKLFTMLKNAYTGEGDLEQKADTIEVTYDPKMGYPTNFYIDVSQNIADEEQGYTVTNLIARTTTEQVQDYDSFVDNLRAAGATVEHETLPQVIVQDFFSVTGQVFKVNGEEVQLFEYNNQSEAEAAAAFVSPDGSSVGTSMPFWMAPPHFYKDGRIIVLYVGENAAVMEILDKVLGPQFAGKQVSSSLTIEDEIAIYAGVIRQLSTVDDTFGGNLNPETLYVIENTDDSAGNPVEGQQSDTRMITETMQSEISNILNDLSAEIIWIDRFEDAEFEETGFEVKRGGAIITLGNIYSKEDGSVQVAGSIYIANLAAGGTTYILEKSSGSWEITGHAGPVWMS
jgi:major membrane immunogen (membrane-anchored lipoprotein)